MSAELFADAVRALNELVSAAERLELPPEADDAAAREEAEALISDARTKASAARLALIELDLYDPYPPRSP